MWIQRTNREADQEDYCRMFSLSVPLSDCYGLFMLCYSPVEENPILTNIKDFQIETVLGFI